MHDTVVLDVDGAVVAVGEIAVVPHVRRRGGIGVQIEDAQAGDLGEQVTAGMNGEGVNIDKSGRYHGRVHVGDVDGTAGCQRHSEAPFTRINVVAPHFDIEAEHARAGDDLAHEGCRGIGDIDDDRPAVPVADHGVVVAVALEPPNLREIVAAERLDLSHQGDIAVRGEGGDDAQSRQGHK